MGAMGHVTPFRPRRERLGLLPMLLGGVLLGLASGVWLAGGPPAAGPVPLDQRGAEEAELSVRFTVCGGGARVNCVVDGDTLWIGGEKVRLSDINTPETGDPGCAREAALGERATSRLTELVNAGEVTLVRGWGEDDRDRYGRLLREVHVGGASVGGTLMAEGLAHEWRGRREGWC